MTVSIDMTAYQVSAEHLRKTQGLFQIHRSKPVKADGALQAFLGYVDIKVGIAFIDHRHACAVDRNRIAQGHIRKRHVAGLNAQSQTVMLSKRAD